VVIQQVYFVNVKQPAVGSRQNAGLKMPLALLNGALNVQRADHAVFSGGNWQVHKRRRAHDRGQRLV